jgi:hypothetical protein
MLIATIITKYKDESKIQAFSIHHFCYLQLFSIGYFFLASKIFQTPGVMNPQLTSQSAVAS